MTAVGSSVVVGKAVVAHVPVFVLNALRFALASAILMLLAALLCYVFAKVLELFDDRVYGALGSLVSGHTLKHLMAGVGAYLVLIMLKRRQAYPNMALPDARPASARRPILASAPAA